MWPLGQVYNVVSRFRQGRVAVMHVAPIPSKPAGPNNSRASEEVTWRIELQERNLDRLLDWIRAVDTKTPIVMAIDTAMLGVVIALLPEPRVSTAQTVFWIAFGSSSLVLGLLLCALATFPQMAGPKNSLIFFGGIAGHTQADYARAVAGRSANEYLDDLNTQCHRNAQIALSKYKQVQRAVFWLLFGIGPWLITVYALTRG